jgi:hypothetical protein
MKPFHESSEPDRDYSYRKFSDFIRRSNQEALLATVAQCTLPLPPHLSGDGDSRYIAKLTSALTGGGGVNAGRVLGAVENTGEGEHHPDDEVAEGGSAGVVSSGPAMFATLSAAGC